MDLQAINLGNKAQVSSKNEHQENVCSWHGVAPNAEEYKQAMEELNALYI